jgi:nicotinate-nucleotide pyrophosphorylase (carboxylating)
MEEELKRAFLEAARRALDEDLGARGDVTTEALIPRDLEGVGEIYVWEDGVVAGLPLASMVFRLLSPRVDFRPLKRDGEKVTRGEVLAEIRGPLHAILEGERTALNFLQRLSGIATVTARCVEVAAPRGVEILDTRKTTPGLRELEKYAVRAGGGANHRKGLYDGVLIKDNHIAVVGSPGEAVRRARERLGGMFPVEVEIRDLEQLEEVIAAGADMVLLDNFTPGEVREAVRQAAGRVVLEVSGGVTPDNLEDYVSTGVDRISMGYLTHSSRALDMSLELRCPGGGAGKDHER